MFYHQLEARALSHSGLLRSMSSLDIELIPPSRIPMVCECNRYSKVVDCSPISSRLVPPLRRLLYLHISIGLSFKYVGCSIHIFIGNLNRVIERYAGCCLWKSPLVGGLSGLGWSTSTGLISPLGDEAVFTISGSV